MPTETTTRLVARPLRDQDAMRDARFAFIAAERRPVIPLEMPAQAQGVEILRVATTTHRRSDGRRLPDMRTETVLATVPLADVPNLVRSLAQALVDGLTMDPTF